MNHLIDIASAHPEWTGYADFFSLLGGTAILAWLWRTAETAERSGSGRCAPRPRSTPRHFDEAQLG